MAQKKIVITVSKQFPKTKGRCGEPTRFREKLATGEKIHTIRRNFDLWRVNSEKMERGGYYLSIRQWMGKPYRTKQEEIRQIHEPIGVQRISLHWIAKRAELTAKVDGVEIDPKEIAKNDGLPYEDFIDWFFEKEAKMEDAHFDGVIIHFTPFRYTQSI